MIFKINVVESQKCFTMQGCIQKIFPGGGKLGPHKRMTLAIMVIAYIYTSICLLRFALFT